MFEESKSKLELQADLKSCQMKQIKYLWYKLQQLNKVSMSDAKKSLGLFDASSTVYYAHATCFVTHYFFFLSFFYFAMANQVKIERS